MLLELAEARRRKTEEEQAALAAQQAASALSVQDQMAADMAVSLVFVCLFVCLIVYCVVLSKKNKQKKTAIPSAKTVSTHYNAVRMRICCVDGLLHPLSAYTYISIGCSF